jgi:hypothetical protein
MASKTVPTSTTTTTLLTSNTSSTTTSGSSSTNSRPPKKITLQQKITPQVISSPNHSTNNSSTPIHSLESFQRNLQSQSQQQLYINSEQRKKSKQFKELRQWFFWQHSEIKELSQFISQRIINNTIEYIVGQITPFIQVSHIHLFN